MQMETILRTFINDNNYMRCILINRDVLTFTHHSYVGFDYNKKSVELLICGTCPLCKSNIIRDVCIKTYCDEVISPLLKERFKQIQNVTCVNSTDPRIPQLVANRGGDLQTINTLSDSYTYFELFRMFADRHPLVDGGFKVVSHREPSDDRAINQSEILNGTMFFNKYKLSYVIGSDTKFIGTDKRMYIGKNDIVRNANKLPNGLVIIRSNSDGMAVLMVNKLEFFDNSVYKRAVF